MNAGNFLFMFVFCAFLNISSLSQEFISIHQIEYQNHKIFDKKAGFYNMNGKDIIAIRNLGKELSVAIFGYLPDWEYLNARNYLDYSLLTHIAAFDFTVSSTGSISDPSYWPWTDVINRAHSNGVKVILTAVNFNPAEIHNILTNTSIKQELFNNLRTRIETYKLDGVNIDFESLEVSDRGNLLNTFMQDLTNFIHSQLPGKEVSFAAPAVNWGGWDLKGLANSCDYLFIMGYDFYGSWSTTTGACAPLTGGNYNITNTINVQYRDVTLNSPDKLILGVPYYGKKWKAQDEKPHSSVVQYIGSTFYRDDILNSQLYGQLWAYDSQTPWYRYQSGTDWYQVWFETDSSLGLKYQLAQSKNYRGVGMWALGYDGNRTELWNELRKRFSIVNFVENPDQSNFFLSQNYPNPFNSSTNIGFRITSTSGVFEFVSLKVFDIYGREITKLVNEKLSPGEYSVTFNGNHLACGVYFYILKSDKFQERRKMVFLK